MIQFNLLPDIKLQYIRMKRLKQTMMSVSILVAGGSLVLAALLFVGVNFVQKKHMNDLSKDVTKAAQKLQTTPDINRIITVQNQLNSLTALHDSKPAASRLFDYLSQVTPSSITVSTITVDFKANTMSIEGGGKSLLAVNTLVDTLKFTNFTSDVAGSKKSPAFSKVLLSSFASSDKSATYQVTLAFDPAIFNNLQKIHLSVPDKITTRSQLSQPTELLQAPAPATTTQPTKTKTGVR